MKTVEPEDLFCKHDLPKGGVSKSKFIYILMEGNATKKKRQKKISLLRESWNREHDGTWNQYKQLTNDPVYGFMA